MSTTPQTPVITLTEQNVLDLLDCAGYGLASWAQSATIDADAKTYRVVEGDVDPAGDVPVDKTLTFNEVRSAFRTLAAQGALPDWQMREIAAKDLAFDATVADMTIQQAVFGEIIFG